MKKNKNKTNFEYLVIGSNSFSGSNFVASLLDKNKNVIGVSRSKEIDKVYLPYKWKSYESKFIFFKIDINKDCSKLIKLVNKFKIKFIINFSSLGMVEESFLQPYHWYNTNITSSTKFIEGIKDFKFIKKFINFSTPEVYGNTSGWQSETNIFKPSTPYAISRAAFDSHLLIINKIYNFPVIITRTANIYGPGQQLYRIIPRAIIFSKLKKKIYMDGGGKTRRSFIYSADVCEALHKILIKGKVGNVYHISTNNIVTIKSIVKIILKKLSVNYNKIVKNSKDRKGKDLKYMLLSNKIRKIGWRDKVPLKIGIDLTIKWINSNFHFLANKEKNFFYQHKK